MAGTVLKVLVEFIDGREPITEEMPVTFPPGKEVEACMKLLSQINLVGGIMHFLDDGISLIPLQTIKLLTITAPSVVSSDLGELNALTSKIKLA